MGFSFTSVLSKSRNDFHPITQSSLSVYSPYPYFYLLIIFSCQLHLSISNWAFCPFRSFKLQNLLTCRSHLNDLERNLSCAITKLGKGKGMDLKLKSRV